MARQIRIPDRPVLELSPLQATARDEIEQVLEASTLNSECFYTGAPGETTYLKSLVLAVVIVALIPPGFRVVPMSNQGQKSGRLNEHN
jgi:hypothetical protein